jgi:hypothetical protein
VRGCAEGKGAIARKGMLKEACSVQKHEEAVSHKERYAKGWLHLPSRIAWTHLHIIQFCLFSHYSFALRDLGGGGNWVRRDESLRWGMSPPSGLGGGLHLSFILKSPHLPIASCTSPTSLGYVAAFGAWWRTPLVFHPQILSSPNRLIIIPPCPSSGQGLRLRL